MLSKGAREHVFLSATSVSIRLSIDSTFEIKRLCCNAVWTRTDCVVACICIWCVRRCCRAASTPTSCTSSAS